MARYKYVVGMLLPCSCWLLSHWVLFLGDTPHEFLQMRSSRQTKADLKRLRGDIALLAVNDDIQGRPELVGPILTRWMASRWRTRAEWES